MSPEQKYFGVIAVVTLFLSIGRYLPFFSSAVQVVPLLRLFRNPNSLLYMFAFCMSVLTGPILENLQRISQKNWRLIRWDSVSIPLMLVLLLTQRFWFSTVWHFAHIKSAFHTIEKDQVIFATDLKIVVVMTSIFFAQVYVLTKKHRVFDSIFLGLLFFELWFAASPSLLFAPASIYEEPSEQAEFLRQHIESGYRYVTVTDLLPYSGFSSYFHDITVQPPFADSRFTGNEQRSFSELINRRQNLGSRWGMVSGLDTPFGYSTFVLQNIAAYWKNNNRGTGGAEINTVDVPMLADGRLQHQSVRYVLLDRRIYPDIYLQNVLPNAKEVGRGNSWIVLELPDALQMVRPATHNSIAKVTKVTLAQNSLQFHFNAGHADTIFIGQNFFPGWRCRVELAQCALHEADGGMTIDLPAGQHTVLLVYAPSHLWILVLISGTSVFLYLIWCGWNLGRAGTIRS